MNTGNPKTGNFANGEEYLLRIIGETKLEQEKLKVNKKEENLMLSASLVDELTIVLTGGRVSRDALVEQIKEISDILSEQNL